MNPRAHMPVIQNQKISWSMKDKPLDVTLMYMHIHTLTYIHTHIIYRNIYKYTCMRTRVYIHTCICINTSIHTHIYIHTYTYECHLENIYSCIKARGTLDLPQTSRGLRGARLTGLQGSLLQKSPTKETILCKKTYNCKEPTNRSSTLYSTHQGKKNSRRE